MQSCFKLKSLPPFKERILLFSLPVWRCFCIKMGWRNWEKLLRCEGWGQVCLKSVSFCLFSISFFKEFFSFYTWVYFVHSELETHKFNFLSFFYNEHMEKSIIRLHAHITWSLYLFPFFFSRSLSLFLFFSLSFLFSFTISLMSDKQITHTFKLTEEYCFYIYAHI